jgi:hypothetical protein
MKKIFMLCALSVLTMAGFANGIRITNVSLTGQNTTNQTTKVQFDVSWNNSWRVSAGPANWDAAWVFVKFRVGTGNWQHARIASTGNTAPTGSTIAVGLLTPGTAYDATTNPGMGVFIHRSADGNGTFSLTGVQLLWNYGSQGIANNAAVDVQVYGVEMVYVNEGAFWAGDGSVLNANAERSLRQGSSDNDPWYIGSEGQISVNAGAGSGTGVNSLSTTDYYYNVSAASNVAITGEQATGSAFSIPAAFPKGFKAMYVMKYEITTNQYLEFFNALTSDQKLKRDLTTGSVAGIGGQTSPSGAAGDTDLTYRNTFTWTTGNATFGTANPTYSDEACNFLAWPDIAAYLDWASLRPMTELEFEKAARGPMSPVSQEFAWGTTNISTVRYTLTNEGDPAEAIATNYSTNSGNANYTTTYPTTNSGGPLRVGIFATSTSNRETAGASYWGIMELTGNVFEMVIPVGMTAAHTYTGVHGNGSLDGNGDYDVATWPANSSNNAGSLVGRKGSSWYSSANEGRVSDRLNTCIASGYTSRTLENGGRGVRTAN